MSFLKIIKMQAIMVTDDSHQKSVSLSYCNFSNNNVASGIFLVVISFELSFCVFNSNLYRRRLINTESSTMHMHDTEIASNYCPDNPETFLYPFDSPNLYAKLKFSSEYSLCIELISIYSSTSIQIDELQIERNVLSFYRPTTMSFISNILILNNFTLKSNTFIYSQNNVFRSSVAIIFNADSFQCENVQILNNESSVALISFSNISSVDITIKNTSFIENVSISSLLILSSLNPIILEHCEFKQNVSEVLISFSLFDVIQTEVLISEVKFNSNILTTGCIRFTGIKSLLLVNSDFTNNQSSNFGSAINLNLEFTESSSSSILEVVGCKFTENSSVFYIGPINSDELMLKIDSCTFSKNVGNYGAVIYIAGAVADGSFIKNSIFEGNDAIYDAAVNISIKGNSFTIENCIFKNNKSSKMSVLSVSMLGEGKFTLSTSTFDSNFGDKVINILLKIPRTIYLDHNTFISNSCAIFKSEIAQINDYGSVFQSNQFTPVNLLRNSSAVFKQTKFLQNNGGDYAAGAVFNSQNSSFECDGCEFSLNSSLGRGGAIFCEQDSRIILANTLFQKNSANFASAIYLNSGKTNPSSVKGCIFKENISANQGTIYLIYASFTMSNSQMQSNQILNVGCPGLNAFKSDVTVTDSEFRSQIGNEGGFINANVNSELTINSSSFTQGTATLKGGAIFLRFSTISASDSTFTFCTSEIGGSLMLFNSNTTARDLKFEGNTAHSFGGDVAITQGNFEMTGATSKQSIGNSVYLESTEQAVIAESKFMNCTGSCIYSSDVKRLTVNDTSFNSSISTKGGGFFATATSNSEVSLSSCFFFNNSACEGGAIVVSHVNSTISNNTFLSNVAACGTSLGGAIAAECKENCYTLVVDNQFSNNAARSGGVIRWNSLAPNLLNNSYTLNQAVYGPVVAAYPKLLNFTAQNFTEVIFSGQQLKQPLEFFLTDEIGQIVRSDNSTSCYLTSNSLQFTGAIEQTSQMGKITFTNISAIASPGSNVNFTVSCRDFTTEPVTIAFYLRPCVGGETQINDQCFVCPEGKYNFDPTQTCKECPAEAVCYGNNTIAPKQGYWRETVSTASFYECKRTSSCLGPDLSNLNLLGNCLEGYHGVTCSGCISGYSRTKRYECSECYKTNASQVVRVLSGIGFLAFAVASVIMALRSASKQISPTSILFKVLTNFFQITTILFNLKVEWPTNFTELMGVSLSAGDAAERSLNVDCIFSDMNSEETLYLNVIAMAAIPFILIAGAVLIWSFVRVFRKVKFFKEKVLGSVTVLIFFVLPYITKLMFSLFSCDDVEGNQYLSTDLSVKCWTTKHRLYALAVALPSLLIWIVIIPPLCIVFLWFRRTNLEKESTQLVLGFVYSGFKNNFFFWEFVILYRKVLIILISVFMTSVGAHQLSTAIMAVVFFLFLQIRLSPYIDANINATEVLSLIASFVTALCGFFFVSSENYFWSTIILLIFTTLAYSAFFYAWLRFVCRIFLQKLLVKYPKLAQNFCCKFMISFAGTKAILIPEPEVSSIDSGISHILSLHPGFVSIRSDISLKASTNLEIPNYN